MEVSGSVVWCVFGSVSLCVHWGGAILGEEWLVGRGWGYLCGGGLMCWVYSRWLCGTSTHEVYVCTYVALFLPQCIES